MNVKPEYPKIILRLRIEEESKMYSRRKVLIRLFLFIPTLFVPTALLNSISNHLNSNRSGKFIKGGWVLKGGDV
jgi:hypothetical protein